MLKRLALVPLSLLLLFVVLEAGLQVASFFAKRSLRGEQPLTSAGDLRVLCVGDSNTYGLYVEREEAYPAQLETLWNATHDSPKLQVLNVGMPGTNSWWLLRELDRLLDTFEPDLVLILVGANDFWTRAPPSESAAAPFWSRLLRRSRLFKGIYMAWRSRDARQIEVANKIAGPTARQPVPLDELRARGGGGYTARYGDEVFEMDFTIKKDGEADRQRDAESLERNLETLAGRIRKRGARPSFLTYAAPRNFYLVSDEPIRAAAQASGTPLVDVAAVFRPRCPRASCSELLFSDGHPTAEGYHLVAETVVQWLSESLSP